MKQLILDLALPTPWTVDNFIAGPNAEAVHFVLAMATTPLPECSLYLWGESGAGKTHLLQAVVRMAQRSAYYVDCRQQSMPSDLAQYDLLAIDHIEHCSPAQQIMLFDLYNTFKEKQQNFLAAGIHPPMLSPLRSDLATRLGWGLVYELKALSEQDKRIALQQRALHLGFSLTEAMLQYLFTHAARDLPALIRVLTQLDQLALTDHRQITLPLLRKVLQPADGELA